MNPLLTTRDSPVEHEDAKQALRLRRYFIAAWTSLLSIGLMLAGYLLGFLSRAAFYQSASLVLLAILIFYIVFRSGLNRRFSDPNLTVAQISASTLVTLFTMYASDGARAVFLVLLLMIFLFSVLRLTTRALLVYAACILVGYGALIGLLWRFKPQSLDLPLELLLWLTLALTLPWFALMGGFITGLRNNLRKSNNELQGVLLKVQESEASLAQAQHIAGLGSWTFDPVRRCATWSLETYRLFGIDPARPALIGEQFLRLVHPQDQRHYNELIRPALRDGRSFDDRFRIVRPTGEIRCLHVLGQPVANAGGHTTLLRGTVTDITERNAQEERLTLARDQATTARATLVDAIESLTDAFGLFDADDRLVLCNRNYAQTFTAFDRFEDIVGMRFEDLVRSSLAKGEVIEPAFQGNVEAWVTERIRRHRNPGPEPRLLLLGDRRWFEVSEQHTRSGGVVGIRRDISGQKRNEQRQAMEYTVTRLLAESETLRDAVPQIIQAVCETLAWDCGACWVWDKQNQLLRCAESWSVASPEVRKFVALSSQQSFASGSVGFIRRVWTTGEPIWIADVSEEPGFLRADIAAKAGLRAAFAFPIRIGAELHGVIEFYIRDVRQSDPALLAATRSIGSQIGQFIARKAAEDEIWRLAFYDPLTRLPNRRLLIDRLQQALAASPRSKRHGALLFIDLDNFKAINDTLGHDAGDLLLRQAAERLSSCVRVGDTVARQGGDEFVIMLMDLSMAEEEAAVQTKIIGEKILAVLNRPYQFPGHLYHNTASIGATLFDGHIASADEVLRRADLAMYHAKAAGRNALRFFEPGMQAFVTLRAELETAIRQGLEHGQFVLYYQAQIDDAGCVSGAEVLLRWQHPLRGLVSPVEFIPVAEETGLILPLGRWVLETACAQLVAWSSRPATADLNLAVNVSARQFRQPDFVTQVVELLDRTGANPRKLKLELTESMLVDNMEEIIAKMSVLRALGVVIALDDFGIGYSSLSYLKRLPLDQLKIDRSFVRDVLTEPTNAAIVLTIVALAQSLGLSVIAEGVETEPQREFLASHGCGAYQGYLHSRPLPLEQFEALNLRGVGRGADNGCTNHRNPAGHCTDYQVGPAKPPQPA